jgi:putative addiction module component (TIGR02574 family)
MPKPVPLPPPGFDELSVDEKIDDLQSLWDRIAATPETIPVCDWHREILDERLKDLEADTRSSRRWTSWKLFAAMAEAGISLRPTAARSSSGPCIGEAWSTDGLTRDQPSRGKNHVVVD